MEDLRVPFSNWQPGVYGWDQMAARLPSRLTQPMSVTLIRHGETTSNASGLVSGSSDVPLNLRGREQAKALGASLDGTFDVAFHSTLRRSRETLACAASAASFRFTLGCEESRVSERSMGCLEGMPSEPLPAYDAGDLDWAPSEGESYRAVTQRVLSFLLDLASAASELDRPSRVLLSSHAGVMRVISAIFDRVSSPSQVMTRQFVNASVWRQRVACLPWPDFIESLS